MTYRLEIVPEEFWPGVVATAWAERLRTRLRVCLPTGATPRPVYREVAALADFSATTVFVLDEFGLPAGDPARCDQMLGTDLLSRLSAPPELVDSLDPEKEDLVAECRRYSATVADGGLDLTLLGLGRNGHLGLNEPGSRVDSPTRVVELADETRRSLVRYGAREATDWGMTLGLREIMASEEIWLLVRGAHKTSVLRRTLGDPVGPHLPATYLREHPNVVIWADEAAAAEV